MSRNRHCFCTCQSHNFLPHSKKIPRSTKGHLSVYSLHDLPMPAWVYSGYSGFLPTVQRHKLGQLATRNCPKRGTCSSSDIFSLCVHGQYMGIWVMWYSQPINNKQGCCSWPGTQNNVTTIFDRLQWEKHHSSFCGAKGSSGGKRQKRLDNDREDSGYRKGKCIIWSKCVSFSCPSRETPRWRNNNGKWNYTNCCWHWWILQTTGVECISKHLLIPHWSVQQITFH